MCVCMCVCVCVCVYVCMCVSLIFVCSKRCVSYVMTNIHERLLLDLNNCLLVPLNISRRIKRINPKFNMIRMFACCTGARPFVCTYVSVRPCACICMYVCVYMCIMCMRVCERVQLLQIYTFIGNSQQTHHWQ